MNKNTLIAKVKSLALPSGSYCVLAGGAMLFYGLREQTQDVDLHINDAAFAHLQATQQVCLLDEDRRHYAIGEDIEFYVTAQEQIVCEQREGIFVQTPQEILALKKRLGREKDAADIAALQRYIEMNSNAR